MPRGKLYEMWRVFELANEAAVRATRLGDELLSAATIMTAYAAGEMLGVEHDEVDRIQSGLAQHLDAVTTEQTAVVRPLRPKPPDHATSESSPCANETRSRLRLVETPADAPGVVGARGKSSG